MPLAQHDMLPVSYPSIFLHIERRFDIGDRDPWVAPFDRVCLNLTRTKGRPRCTRPLAAIPHDEICDAVAEVTRLAQRPPTRAFFESVRHFVELRHCGWHKTAVLGRIADWEDQYNAQIASAAAARQNRQAYSPSVHTHDDDDTDSAVVSDDSDDSDSDDDAQSLSDRSTFDEAPQTPQSLAVTTPNTSPAEQKDAFIGEKTSAQNTDLAPAEDDPSPPPSPTPVGKSRPGSGRGTSTSASTEPASSGRAKAAQIGARTPSRRSVPSAVNAATPVLETATTGETAAADSYDIFNPPKKNAASRGKKGSFVYYFGGPDAGPSNAATAATTAETTSTTTDEAEQAEKTDDGRPDDESEAVGGISSGGDYEQTLAPLDEASEVSLVAEPEQLSGDEETILPGIPRQTSGKQAETPVPDVPTPGEADETPQEIPPPAAAGNPAKEEEDVRDIAAAASVGPIPGRKPDAVTNPSNNAPAPPTWLYSDKGKGPFYTNIISVMQLGYAHHTTYKKGRIYVLREPHIPGVFKIGFSGQANIQKRFSGTPCTSEAAQNKPVYLSKAAFPGAYKAETLIKATLKHRRIDRCKLCNDEHQEWFEIEEHEIVAWAEAWTAYVQSEVYDADGVPTLAYHRFANSLLGLTPERIHEHLARLLPRDGSGTNEPAPNSDDDGGSIASRTRSQTGPRERIRRAMTWVPASKSFRNAKERSVLEVTEPGGPANLTAGEDDQLEFDLPRRESRIKSVQSGLSRVQSGLSDILTKGGRSKKNGKKK